jgi:addiction module RelE/StbE family toxin
MPRLIWTAEALNDTKRLYDFLSKKNLPAAKKAIQIIRSEINIMADYPESGRPIKDTDYREWVIPFGKSGYLALYRYDNEVIAILAVRHQLETDYEI